MLSNLIFISSVYIRKMFDTMNVNGGNVKVYTGPKKGRFYINKSGKKVYLDRKTLNTEFSYVRKAKTYKKATV
jgi:lipopolysaccharide export system protein LptA